MKLLQKNNKAISASACFKCCDYKAKIRLSNHLGLRRNARSCEEMRRGEIGETGKGRERPSGEEEERRIGGEVVLSDARSGNSGCQGFLTDMKQGGSVQDIRQITIYFFQTQTLQNICFRKYLPRKMVTT